MLSKLPKDFWDYVQKGMLIMKLKPDLITFSGDKLIGGPQSGIIIGNKKILKRIQSNSLYRVLRCDKITIAFIEEILKSFRIFIQ